MPDEVVSSLRALGPVVERPNTYGAGTGISCSAQHLKVVWEQLVTGSEVIVLLHAFLQEVQVSDGRVQRLTLATTAPLTSRRCRA